MTKKDLEMQIEMLVKDDQHSQETIVRQAQEIERLNYIINEFEEYLVGQFNKTQDDKYCDDLIKLKKLKGE